MAHRKNNSTSFSSFYHLKQATHTHIYIYISFQVKFLNICLECYQFRYANQQVIQFKQKLMNKKIKKEEEEL
jgi:hypothetical protein